MEKSNRISLKWFGITIIIFCIIFASYKYGSNVIKSHSVAGKCFVEQPQSESACYDLLCFGNDGKLSLTSYFQNGKIRDEVPDSACCYTVINDKMLIKVTDNDISKEYTIKWINKNSFQLIDNNNVEATLALKGSVDDKTKID